MRELWVGERPSYEVLSLPHHYLTGISEMEGELICPGPHSSEPWACRQSACGVSGPHTGGGGLGLRAEEGRWVLGRYGKSCWQGTGAQGGRKCSGTWVSGGLTDGSKGPVLDHKLRTEGKVTKAQVLQLFLSCLKAVVGKEDDGGVVSAGGQGQGLSGRETPSHGACECLHQEGFGGGAGVSRQGFSV